MKTREQILESLFEIAEDTTRAMAHCAAKRSLGVLDERTIRESAAGLAIVDAMRWLLSESDCSLKEHLNNKQDIDGLFGFLQPYMDAMPRK